MAHFSDVSGTMQLLNSDHVRERDEALLRGVLVGGVWNGFFVGEGQELPCALSVLWWMAMMIMMAICFRDCTFPPLVEIRENPELLCRPLVVCIWVWRN